MNVQRNKVESIESPSRESFCEFQRFGWCSDMYNEWSRELKMMNDRLTRLRQQLVDALSDRGKSILINLLDSPSD